MYQGGSIRVGVSEWEYQGGSIRVGVSGWEYQGGSIRVGVSEWEYQGGSIRVGVSGWEYAAYLRMRKCTRARESRPARHGMFSANVEKKIKKNRLINLLKEYSATQTTCSDYFCQWVQM